MSYVQNQQKKLMEERLQKDATIAYSEILDIINAYQVASMNAIGTGEIKGILTFLDKGMKITIHNNEKQEIIKNKFLFANFLKSIDSAIDLTTSRNFTEYF